MRDSSANVIIGIWDLDSGQPVQAAAMTYARAQRQLAGGLVWAGPDTLLCNQTFFHMGLHEMIGNNRWGNAGQLAGPSPDARPGHRSRRRCGSIGPGTATRCASSVARGGGC